jgi:hypothetical protein
VKTTKRYAKKIGDGIKGDLKGFPFLTLIQILLPIILNLLVNCFANSEKSKRKLAEKAKRKIDNAYNEYTGKYKGALVRQVSRRVLQAKRKVDEAMTAAQAEIVAIGILDEIRNASEVKIQEVIDENIGV